jgi:hypothetical protein
MSQVIGLRNIGVVDVDPSGIVIDRHFICGRDLSIKLSNISAVSIVRNPMNMTNIVLGLFLTAAFHNVVTDEIARIIAVLTFIFFTITNFLVYVWGKSCNILIVTNSAVVFRIANQSEKFLINLKRQIEKAMMRPDDAHAYEAVFASREIPKIPGATKRIACYHSHRIC